MLHTIIMRCMVRLTAFGSIRRFNVLIVSVFFILTGCGEFFSEKSTEVQSQRILKNLSRIETISDANVVVLPVDQKSPRYIRTDSGFELFYFGHHHTVNVIEKIIKDQLGLKTAVNLAVNQIIITCKDEQEVNTTLAFLEEVDIPPIQVKIDCMVSQLYADITMDWETTIAIEDLFGIGVTLSGKEVDGDILPAFPGAALRDTARENIGLKVGIVDEDNFKALLDLLVSKGYLKVLMNPKLEVINGQKAKIQARDQVPLSKEVLTKEGVPYMTTSYEWVEDSLEITPHVFADGYIGLETTIKLGSKNTPEGVKQVPIITERSIENKENRIRQGQSLIIGGLRKSEKRSVVRGVPFLKDIPYLGILFSSKDYEDRATEVIFVITPTISRYGISNSVVMDQLKAKHASPTTSEFHDVLLDSMGIRSNRIKGILQAERYEREQLIPEEDRKRSNKDKEHVLGDQRLKNEQAEDPNGQELSHRKTKGKRSQKRLNKGSQTDTNKSSTDGDGEPKLGKQNQKEGHDETPPSERYITLQDPNNGPQ